LRWGAHDPNALDMEPIVRKYYVQFLGNDPKKWGILDIQVDPRLTEVAPGIEVVKTGHDAFVSSNLDFILKNLGIQKIFIIGGHTNACYLGTSQSAKKKGYTTISIEDATTDAAESLRLKGIEKANFDYIIKTKDLNKIK
jgi:nicotinamidase-related amidase